jgi:hypothetical protein
LKAQTDMVGLSKDYQDLLGNIADLQGQFTILKQKRLRVNCMYSLHFAKKKKAKQKRRNFRFGVNQ